MLVGYSKSQFIDPATTADPCAQQIPPTGGGFSDNLSCPRLDGVLQCYRQSEFCNGPFTPFCTGGSDEGTNLVSLDCKPMIMSTS